MTAAAPNATRVAGHGSIEFWIVEIRDRPASDALGWLSAAELARAMRFRFPRDRDRYLAAHAALRLLIAQRVGRPPGALEFTEGRFGKPSLSGSPHCHFNMSYAGDVALVGLSHAEEIGVDLEAVLPIDDAAALAILHFTPAERRQVAAMPDPASRLAAFFCGWSRKEACLKALGTGLQIAPSALETGVEIASRALETRSARLEVSAFTPIPGYIAACARVLPPAERR